jgi:hypothetical protein
MCLEKLKQILGIVSLYDAPYPAESKPKVYAIPTELRQDFYTRYYVTDPEWFTVHVSIKIDPNFTGGAESLNDAITFNPKYANIPTLAHEMCHSVYSKLTDEQRERFARLLFKIVPSNRMMELAIKDYGNSKYWYHVQVCEAHSQIYRFFGKELPDDFREFYPFLI